MAQRSLLIDGLKILASQLIVLHHIALYAPMAEVVAPWPTLAELLADETRFRVQSFLVIGGLLAAQGLARHVPSLPRGDWPNGDHPLGRRDHDRRSARQQQRLSTRGLVGRALPRAGAGCIAA